MLWISLAKASQNDRNAELEMEQVELYWAQAKLKLPSLGKAQATDNEKMSQTEELDFYRVSIGLTYPCGKIDK